MSEATKVGAKLVEFCKQGKNMEAIEALYSPEIVSIEAAEMPQLPREMKGLEAIKGKNQWWAENHEVHSAQIDGPFPNDDRFIVHFNYEVTPKQTGKRMQMNEVGLYTVKNGKVVREEFFYQGE